MVCEDYYYVYIVCSSAKTVLYTGVTNNLAARLAEHWQNRGNKKSFAGKYYCNNLVYHERHQFIQDAIQREKEIKKWNRKKKSELIESINPLWEFLNEKICGDWPPIKTIKRY